MNEKRMQKLIVTRVPPALADLIERRAGQELMPVATYVRRLLLNAVTTESQHLKSAWTSQRQLHWSLTTHRNSQNAGQRTTIR